MENEIESEYMLCVTHKVLSEEAKKSEQGRLVLERNVKQLRQKLDEASTARSKVRNLRD